MASRKLVKQAQKALGIAATHATVVRDHPDEILAQLRKQGKMTLGELFFEDKYAAARQAVISQGYFDSGKKRIHVRTRPITGTDEHEIMAIAAVSRDPGRAEDFLDTIQDYNPSNKQQDALVNMYWNIYENEGIINNATNKIAAILSGGGRFKIRQAKKGKQQKAREQLEEVLYFWTQKVNAAPDDAVVTGSRGLQAVTHQGVRQALVEGSWIGRTVWAPTDIPTVGQSFDLPINIQSLSTAFIVPVKEFIGTGVEQFFWKPSRDLVKQLTNPSTPEIRKLIKKFIPSDQANKLKKDGQVLLDPALLLHVKHRASDRKAFGESFIHAALGAIAYRRAIDQLDVVSMQNLINRLTIVMVGSADLNSPYSKPDVAAARTALMQSLFDEPGPNMTIIWQGNDVTVEDVGAHAAVLDLDQRHVIGEGKVKIAIGVPDALLSGSTPDGKAAGWAASIGTSAELEETQNSFSQLWTTVGERIALENGFTNLDMVYEFDKSLMTDRMEEMNQTRNDYVSGTMAIRTLLLSRGRDPDAEFRQKAFEMGLDPDDKAVTWEQVFMPPQGMQGQGAGKVPGNGRSPNSVTGNPPATPVEKKTPNTNK